MGLVDKQALQEHIISLIPETIDTDAGMHIYLSYQERLKIAEAIAAGLIADVTLLLRYDDKERG